jgi:hypothetical protein
VNPPAHGLRCAPTREQLQTTETAHDRNSAAAAALAAATYHGYDRLSVRLQTIDAFGPRAAAIRICWTSALRPGLEEAGKVNFWDQALADHVGPYDNTRVARAW